MLSNKKGFTLIEMLVSVGLLALLGIFIATTYTVISQMSADSFVTRKYLHEAVANFENDEYKNNRTNYEVYQNFEVKTLNEKRNCSIYVDQQNGLAYLGDCT